MMELSVNGRTYEVDVDPQTPLLWVLRDVLGLTGTKFGCGAGQCWGCTVLVDGKARPSCTLQVQKLSGAAITTIEGLSAGHAVKMAWIEEQVPQCGYCQPGQIMRAVGLLKDNPNPSREQVRQAMERNLCRCGTYSRIETAVLKAADTLRKEAKS
jgi:aerobic-type carbon monoxide dehydrogenase small subunit (CoxS/CutS family)